MILVTGATGTNGVELINQLTARGEDVRALREIPKRPSNFYRPTSRSRAATWTILNRSPRPWRASTRYFCSVPSIHGKPSWKPT